MSNQPVEPPTASLPHVCVLLATYNGARWIDDQIASITSQRGVRVSVVASDDGSSDGSMGIILNWLTKLPFNVLPPLPERLGSASRNFLRLIRDTDLGDADYFALSDQDDIWLPNKLLRGIECLRSLDAHGYSSNVTALWPNGFCKNIEKAQPQQPLDHLFGSPGPGCTFVIPRSVFSELQAFVIGSFEQLQSIWVHDWLIYAFVRVRGGRWHIDSETNMLYRQHSSNEIGANIGWRSAFSRLRMVRSGTYRRQILAIADAVGERNAVIEALRRLWLIDRLALVMKVRHFRRRLFDCTVLAFLILSMPRD